MGEPSHVLSVTFCLLLCIVGVSGEDIFLFFHFFF